jgi:hypothetical protein
LLSYGIESFVYQFAKKNFISTMIFTLPLHGRETLYKIKIYIIIIYIAHFTAVLLVLICAGLIHHSTKKFLHQASMTVLSITDFCIRAGWRLICYCYYYRFFKYNYINEEQQQQCKSAFNCYLINCNINEIFVFPSWNSVIRQHILCAADIIP